MKKLTSPGVLCNGESQSLKPGDLYGKDLAPLSLQRWEFWEKRLGELLHDGVIQDDTKKHVKEALKVMGSVSKEECI